MIDNTVIMEWIVILFLILAFIVILVLCDIVGSVDIVVFALIVFWIIWMLDTLLGPSPDKENVIEEDTHASESTSILPNYPVY